MADWTDVKNAREDADAARKAAECFEGRVKDAAAFATLLAADALCKEIRALGVLIETVSGDA